MQMPERDAIALRDPLQRQVRIGEVRFDPGLDRAQTGLLRARILREFVPVAHVERERQHIHQLVAKAGPYGLIQRRAFRRERRAELGGDPPKAAARRHGRYDRQTPLG